MLKLNIRAKQSIIIMTIVLGLAGTVFFFPVPMGDQSSCCYESMFGGNENCQCKQAMKEHAAHEGMMSGGSEMHQHGSVLLDSYLHHYAFPWWISVGLLVTGGGMWVRDKKVKSEKVKEKRLNEMTNVQ